MEEQIQRLVDKSWDKYQHTPPSQRVLIAVSGIPGSGKTTLASLVARRLNHRHSEETPGCALQPVAAFVPMDGYHLSRAQLSAMPDPATAHARRGAAFTFDDKAFLSLVKKLREPLLPESKTIYAPSFDHATKDPVENDIPVSTSARIIILEGNYVTLDKGLWKDAASLMDELWFVDVGVDVARRRLVQRHVATGVTPTAEEADRRVTENDLVNGEEIIKDRLEVQEVIQSADDKSWSPNAQGE